MRYFHILVLACKESFVESLLIFEKFPKFTVWLHCIQALLNNDCANIS